MMDSFVRAEYLPVFAKLLQHGACQWCAYRSLVNAKLGEAEFSNFLQEYDQFTLREKNEEELFYKKMKLERNNKCIICLGILSEDLLEEVKTRVLEKVISADFDCDSYMLAVSLPDACELREFRAYVYLKAEFPSLYEKEIYFPQISIKEVWRSFICPSLSQLLKKTLSTKSDLTVQVNFSYEQDELESSKINEWLIENISKKTRFNIRNAIELLGESNFAALYPFPAVIPSTPVSIKSICIKRETIFIAGRYNKFSRKLSQTPWILSDGERKMENSVEEIISTKLKQLAQASGMLDSRFSSSGREDVDARMLGNGRPFAVELINAKISKLPCSLLRVVEKEINKIDPEAVFIRNLQTVNRSDMQHLKIGEEQKTKTYSVVCLVRRQLEFKDLMNLLPQTPFSIKQKTPLRVLHRRTVAVREKTIHELSLLPVENKFVDGCTLIKLLLKTQAGTYVKEFVHGDFGRTVPSISCMFGNIPVDVLALDVMDVHVNWPRDVDYEDSS